MGDAEREKHDEKWSEDNKGQHYGWYPALPYHMAAPDMLHMSLNQVNAATEEAFHSHLLDSAYDNASLKALAADTRKKVNARLKKHADEGGAGVLLTFGMPGSLHTANGPKMKALLRDPTLLVELCALMRPLWAAAEAADEPSVRVRPLSKEELERAAAQAMAAEMTAAAFAPGEGSGGKAPPKKGGAGKGGAGKGGAGKKGNSLANLKRGKQRAVIMPGCAEEELEEARPPATPEPMADTGVGAEATADETDSFTAGLDAADMSIADSLDTYGERVVWMLIAQIEFYQFTHQHQHMSSTLTPTYRKERALQAHALALEVERSMLSVIGTKRRRTYGHDMVYGLPKLYEVLGKPYLGACEHNEHAHQEMKVMFRHMSSKSSKKRSACLQVLDMMVSKRILVDANAARLPRTKYTAMRTGLSTEAKYKARGQKCSDDTMEDVKENLGVLLPVAPVKAKREALDPAHVAKLQKREGGSGGNEGGAHADQAEMPG